ncbi:MAG: hypothetical protein HYR73_02790 [Candidatus Eisenbacteria bacterium]|nr:hypothetical protein [Candidatus Eisenbacteria bacterium]
MLFTAAALVLGLTIRIDDPDLWQHLTVGRAIWQLHRVPTTNLWVWPLYGASDICPSWLFRALLWPFWCALSVGGIYAWSWITALAAFALLWAAARRMGARGFSALFVLALAALSWRHRSQARPETLVAVLLALELGLLVAWRADGRARRVAIAAVLWLWVNAHISWPLGFAVLAGFGADAGWRGMRDAGSARRARAALAALRPYLAIAIAAFALAFANPAGTRAIAQPFDYWLHERNDPLFFTIGELHPLMWSLQWRTGLPLLIAGWPLLIAMRMSRRGLDLAEILLCALFTALAFSSQRFAGLFALTASPFVARDLAERRSGSALSSRFSPWPRFAALTAATLAVSALEWSRPDVPLGVGFDLAQYPVGACDFMASRNLRGPIFNEYYNSGYLLWRFWPDRSRLPFMDIHQSGTGEDRRLYPYVFASAEAWHALDSRRRFELLLLDGSARPVRGNRLPDIVDAETTWALVFRDDNACLYARLGGVNDAIASREGYRWVPGGSAGLVALGVACQRDGAARREARGELERQAASSRFNARASSLLANLSIMEGRVDEAHALLEHALALEPDAPTAHERLGILALGAGHPLDALAEFDREALTGPGSGELDLHRGQALEALGERARATDAYRRQLARRPDDARARDALDRLARGGGP